MSPLTLVIGSKTFSSWSLRPWLFLKHHHVAFEEVLIPLNTDQTRRQILEYSPSGKVPVLLHEDRKIWESLAICEYAAETFNLPAAWPQAADARAFARAIATEMHAGFGDLRNELPFEANREPERKIYSARAAADITRVRSLWREARTRFGAAAGGEWLFGSFGIVDAMFAPVALRFFVYDVALDGPERDYVDSVVLHPSVQAWMEAATLETPVREGPHARTQEIPEAVLAAAHAMNPVVQQAKANQPAAPQTPKIKSFLLPPD
jgi:glutathione S-transferase